MDEAKTIAASQVQGAEQFASSTQGYPVTATSGYDDGGGIASMVAHAAQMLRAMANQAITTIPYPDLARSFELPERCLPEEAAKIVAQKVDYYFLKNQHSGQDADATSEHSAQQPRSAMLAGGGGFDVYAVRKDFPVLSQTVHGGKPLIWLDNAATSQKPNHVIDTVADYYRQYNSNIHRAAHELAARATDAYEGARQKVQIFMGAASSSEIVFVRGTTEGINLIAQTYGKQYVQSGDEIVISASSHHANIVPWQMLANEKHARLKVIPFSENGELQLEELKRLMNHRVRIVASDHVSNVLGTVNPVREITRIAHAHGAISVIDGAQGAPHFKPNVQEIDCDFYVFSGHKVFAPTGIGIVYGKMVHLEDIPPYQGGGNMIEKVTFEHTTYNKPPAKFEAGTGHISGAIGLGAAIDYLDKIGFDAADLYERELLAYGMKQLAEVPGLKLLGTAPNKVSVMSFVLDGIRNDQMGTFLDSEGIAVRSGHHCAQPTLAFYGLDSSVRPSLAFYNTKEDVDALISAIYKAIAKFRR